MRSRARSLLVVVALSIFPIAACADVSFAPVAITVESSDAQGNRAPLEGVRLCEAFSDNCALSDANGEVSIRLPVGRKTVFTMEKDRYVPYLVPVVIESTGSYEDVFTMATDAQMVAQFSRVMSPYPMIGTGTALIAVEPPFAGAIFLGIAGRSRRFYHDEEGRWSVDLTETTSLGLGGFLELDPYQGRSSAPFGSVLQIEFGGTAHDCTGGAWGWPGDGENRVLVPIREGFVTYATARCGFVPP